MSQQDNQNTNTYLGEVLEQQQRLDSELKSRKVSSLSVPAARGDKDHGVMVPVEPPRGVETRITGFWRWRSVVVPPNVYVVHTRRGHADPIHIGLGTSFRYNPYTDAFLVVPATVQTIIISARCICVERQGILVQAYVQWVVDDIGIAYRRWDFSDPDDPMRIVNVQLREQAEAAIKDKVATMGVDEVLSDKQPIIVELVHRLRAVAEGREGQESTGLGLKIVTVQIKEAVVSSTRLWENLQAPFRAEREKLARMAELGAAREIKDRELEHRQAGESAELSVESELLRLRAAEEGARFQRELEERACRHELEQAAEQRAISERTAAARARAEAEAALQAQAAELEVAATAQEVARLEAARTLAVAQEVAAAAALESELAMSTRRHEVRSAEEEREIALLGARRRVENDLSEAAIRARLVELLPELASRMPKPTELRSIAISGEAGAAAPLLSFLAQAMGVVEGLRGGKGADKQGMSETRD